MPCIQKARKVQSQVLVFCPDPSITFQLRPVPSLPRSSISFPPFPFLLSIYGFLYLPTTSSPTFSLFFRIPEFTFELSPRIYLNRLSISPHPRLLNHVSTTRLINVCERGEMSKGKGRRKKNNISN